MRDLLRYVAVPAAVGGIVGLMVMLMTSGPAADAPGFAAAVRRAAPSVVNIYSTSASHRICANPRYRDWCRSNAGTQNALGSGVVVRENGYILTNNHVIEGAHEILVAFTNGQATTAQVVGTDPDTDLAVIKIQASGLPVIPISSSELTQVGDVALAIGNPFGIGQTVSQGIISAKGRAGITPMPHDDFIQTDAAINPGNSGGALIDSTGALIGINTMMYSRSGGSEGIGFAIPSTLALSILDEIVATGRVTRGWLGIELADGVEPGVASGLRVTRVLPGGPAQLAGIRQGDVILDIAGQPVTHPAVVSRAIATARPGTELALGIGREGSRVDVTAISGLRPRLD
jgi:serine protease DegS